MIRRVGPIVALVAVAALVVLLGLGALMGLGLRGRDNEDPTAQSVSTSTAPTASTTTPATSKAARRDTDGDREIGLVPTRLLAYGTAAPVADMLPSRSVLRVTAIGFGEWARGAIEQCTTSGCTNSFPVAFDDNGNARFQYLVNDTLAGGRSRCRAEDPPCVVRLHAGKSAAYLTTVFHDAAPAPRRVVVDPNEGGLVDGAPVRVSVSGFIPGERVEAMLCVAPETNGKQRCGPPGPTAPFVIDADGTGRTAMVIHAGKVGTDGISCGRGTKCAVVVSSRNSAVPAPAFPISFAAGPSAQYDRARLLIGLALAAVLLAFSVFLVRTTDWRKPTEADTPELDRATFAD